MTVVAVSSVPSSVVTAAVIVNSQQQCAVPSDAVVTGQVPLFFLCARVDADRCTFLTGGCRQLRVVQLKRLITQHSGPFCLPPFVLRPITFKATANQTAGWQRFAAAFAIAAHLAGSKHPAVCLFRDIWQAGAALSSSSSSFITRRIMMLEMGSHHPSLCLTCCTLVCPEIQQFSAK